MTGQDIKYWPLDNVLSFEIYFTNADVILLKVLAEITVWSHHIHSPRHVGRKKAFWSTFVSHKVSLSGTTCGP